MFAAMKVMSAGSKLISIVGYAQGDTSGSSVNTLTINKPSGVVAGDVLVALLSGDGSRTWTMPSGWTEDADQGAQPAIGAAHLVAGGSEPSSYTFTASSTMRMSGVIVALRSAAFDVVGSIDTTFIAPAITLTKDASALFACYANFVSGNTWSTPTGMTPLASQSSVAPSYALFSQLLVPAGSTGTKTSTVTGSATRPGSILFGLKPA